MSYRGKLGLGMLLDHKVGSDLSTWIPDGGFPEWALKGIAVQIRDVLLYLHRRCIVHRDIKPSNVLCEKGADGSMKVYLADFGLAAHAEERDAISNACGSSGYIAPEMFDDAWGKVASSPFSNYKPVTNEEILKIDVFSFGMLLYTVALGANPFAGPAEAEDIFCGSLRSSKTRRNNARGIVTEGAGGSRLSAGLQSLLGWLTAREPGERASVFDAAEHPWFHAGVRALGFAGADEDLRGDSVSWVVFQQVSRRRED